MYIKSGPEENVFHWSKCLITTKIFEGKIFYDEGKGTKRQKGRADFDEDSNGDEADGNDDDDYVAKAMMTMMMAMMMTWGQAMCQSNNPPDPRSVI